MPARHKKVATRESQTRALIGTLPDFIFRFSRDGTYLDYQARNENDLYVPPQQFIGNNVNQVMPPDLAASFKAAFAEASRSRQGVVVEYALPMVDGERHFEARVARIEGGDLLSVVRDVTQSIRAYDELRRNQTALEESHRQVRELASRLLVAQDV